jgi:uncharacterized protein YlxW (UPF0749 family)
MHEGIFTLDVKQLLINQVFNSLSFQLGSLQKENQRLRNDLDREIHGRQTLELQVESKEQTINSLKSQMEARRHLHIENSSPLKEKPVCTCTNSRYFFLVDFDVDSCTALFFSVF